MKEVEKQKARAEEAEAKVKALLKEGRGRRGKNIRGTSRKGDSWRN